MTASGNRIACVDIGSTYTKAALVELPAGGLLATQQAPTTLDDVVRGVLEATGGWGEVPVVACSSAGGGLRLAVVGYEELISAEAGHRAALSAGARVVHVAAGRLDSAAVRTLRGVAPDVVLLVGGTDGGEASVLRHNAEALAASDWSVPVVLAGNLAVRDELAAMLRASGMPVTEADNVLPDIGRLAPESARTAIRAVFLRHVIGGERLSHDPRLRQWVRAVTPDAVLNGVAALARLRTGAQPPGVVVLDVGGATTDVYSVPDPDAEQAVLGREAVGVPARRRTVEGDLGVASSVDHLRVAARADGLAVADDPLALVEAAATIALRRHLRAEAAYGPGGASARGAGLVVLSGGVFRHAAQQAVDGVVERLSADRGGAGSVVAGTDVVVVDRRYVLAAAGLLTGEHPRAAEGLLRALLPG